MATAAARYKLVFFVPPTHLDACKAAIFSAGAGRYPGPGNYTECAFSTPGIGQFRPGTGSKPAIGKAPEGSEGSEGGEVELVGEVRCETLCLGREVAMKAVEELKKAHPYEEPAYEVYKMEDI